MQEYRVFVATDTCQLCHSAGMTPAIPARAWLGSGQLSPREGGELSSPSPIPAGPRAGSSVLKPARPSLDLGGLRAEAPADGKQGFPGLPALQAGTSIT